MIWKLLLRIVLFCPEFFSAREEKEHTFLGRFFTAAIAQKSMVTNKIYSSGNRIAGFSVEQDPGGLKGMAKFGMAAYGQGRGGAS